MFIKTNQHFPPIQFKFFIVPQGEIPLSTGFTQRPWWLLLSGGPLRHGYVMTFHMRRATYNRHAPDTTLLWSSVDCVISWRSLCDGTSCQASWVSAEFRAYRVGGAECGESGAGAARWADPLPPSVWRLWACGRGDCHVAEAEEWAVSALQRTGQTTARFSRKMN